MVIILMMLKEKLKTEIFDQVLLYGALEPGLEFEVIAWLCDQTEIARPKKIVLGYYLNPLEQIKIGLRLSEHGFKREDSIASDPVAFLAPFEAGLIGVFDFGLICRAINRQILQKRHLSRNRTN